MGVPGRLKTSAPEGWSQRVGATLYLEVEALPFLTDSVEKVENRTVPKIS
jgi:hypothetical protein